MAVGPDVVFIAGFPRSGSTLLGDLLAANFRGEHVGETQRLFVRAELEHASCSCGQPLAGCDRWSRAASEISHSFADYEVSALADAMQHHTGLGPIRISPGRRTPIGQEEIAAFIGGVLGSIAEDVDGPLIESSKRPRYGRMLATVPGLTLRVVHLVRDPRAAVSSRLRGGIKKALAGASSSRVLATLSVDSVRWSRANADAASLAKSSARSCLVRYEDLVEHPHRELGRIGRELRLETRPVGPETEPAEADGRFQLNREHVLWGNRGAHAGWVTVQPNVRWVDELSPARRRIISVLCAAGMRKYGYTQTSPFLLERVSPKSPTG